MLLNTTHRKKENEQIITDLVGKSHSLVQRIKLKKFSSIRILIEDVSPNFKRYLNSVSTFNYAHIELRSNGILVRIKNGLNNFTWVIPYYKLVIYKSNGTSIHAEGNFIVFKNNKNLKKNKGFFNILLNEKVKHDLKYDFY